MSLQITSDNIDLSPSMTELAKSKIAKLEHHLREASPKLVNIRVVMNTGKNNTFITKVEMVVEGRKFYSEEERFTLESSLVETIDEVDRQYTKYKSKMDSENWESNRELKRFDIDDAE